MKIKALVGKYSIGEDLEHLKGKEKRSREQRLVVMSSTSGGLVLPGHLQRPTGWSGTAAAGQEGPRNPWPPRGTGRGTFLCFVIFLAYSLLFKFVLQFYICYHYSLTDILFLL